MNGRDGTTAFLPLDYRIGGQGRYNCPTVGQFFTREQNKIHIQKDRDRGNNKYKYDRTKDRARKTAR